MLAHNKVNQKFKETNFITRYGCVGLYDGY